MSKIKCLIIGDQGVGKRTLVSSLTNKDCSTETMNNVSFRGKNYEIQFQDIHGQEALQHIRTLGYYGSNVVIYIYSILSSVSFNHISNTWNEEIAQFCPNIKKILVGTHKELRNDKDVIAKIEEQDTERIVDTEDAENIAKKFEAFLFEINLLEKEDVEKIIQKVVEVGAPIELKEKKDCTIL